ncbi:MULTISPECIES: hypothetical protein [Bradyrhizobium]|jgi:chorismate mutase|uniref:hypothetical protein n=1 Tax=Bradyrhizobium TaxID=374 RepID=UPI00054D375F|nr:MULTISPECIES: hypothetical protein [Bradyrhizobium]AUC97058.1 hypothetical protein CWS35_24535 [Bradyrhizobium sp. SK17]KIU48339.1 hypothetical protein QU41_15365 [Bradyrhizobium elkanii]
MDNKINEIRRRISTLRAEMTLVEATIRDQVNHDLDCTEASYRLLAMRAEVAELIGRWRAAGGGDRLPTVRERLSRSYGDRPVAPAKSDKAKPVPGQESAKVRPERPVDRV